MNMEKGNNTSDRELFSKLFGNPIHPLLIHMVPPFVDENDFVKRYKAARKEKTKKTEGGDLDQTWNKAGREKADSE